MAARTVLAAVVGTLSAIVSAFAHAPPGPSPAHLRLEMFVGKWTSQAEMKASDLGPAGKVTSTSTCEWFQGRFQVVCQAATTAPDGTTVKAIEILGFDPDEGVYTRYNYSSDGSSAFARGKLVGNTWDWRGGGKVGSKTVEVHFPWTMTSSDSYTAKVEILVEGEPPQVVLVGTSTRVK